MKVITILGTRPEIIRLSIIISLLDKYLDHKVVHTGQNYDTTLKDIFYDQLKIRRPDYCFDSKSSTFTEQISKIFINCEKILREEKPNKILILGDTNSALSSFVARRLQIPVYHMEAGNRCYDYKVPEEINRKIIDHCSTIHLPYTNSSKENLIKEGIDKKYIYVIGNPIYEVLKKYIDLSESEIFLKKYNLVKDNYFLVTLHREENVDNPNRLYTFINTLKSLYEIYNIPIIFPAHPRTINNLKKFNIPISKHITLLEPLSFLDFVHLELNAICVLTDSGTVQEETCIYKRPCVTLRDTTERPETVEIGSNIITGCNENNIIKSVNIAIENKNIWNIPEEYLRENVSQTVLNILINNL